MTVQKQALEYATAAHKGQFRSNGRTEFIWHPIQVACLVKSYGYTSDEVVAGAYLHDTVEDTEETYERIHFSFGQKISDIVQECSNPVPDDCEDRHYKNSTNAAHLAAALNRETLLIKCCDRIANLRDISFIHNKSWFKSFTARTEEYLLPVLKKALYGEPMLDDLIVQVEFNKEVIKHL